MAPDQPRSRSNELAGLFLVVVRSVITEGDPRMAFLCRDRFGDHWIELGASDLRDLAERIDRYAPSHITTENT